MGGEASAIQIDPLRVSESEAKQNHAPLFDVDSVDDVATHGASAWQRLTMRGVDIAGALVLVVLGFPLAAVGAFSMKVTSKGPSLFRQKRVGENGQLFEVFKLRTMVDGAHDQVLDDPEVRRLYEENGYKLPADHPHITRVGGQLRRFSIDEIPQGWNVLRGEMSLVGVRPLVQSELADRSAHDRAVYELHKPGLTGLWQVEGRSRVAHPDRIDLDREYLERWSIWLNVKIICRTPKAVLSAFGAH